MASNQPLRWRKASYSGGNGGNCVDLAHTRGHIRDSKNPAGPVLCADVGALLDAVKAGHVG